MNNKHKCTTCKHNTELYCTVGTHLAKQGKKGICYDGELWEPKLTEYQENIINKLSGINKTYQTIPIGLGKYKQHEN